MQFSVGIPQANEIPELPYTMQLLHTLNISLHVVAGIVALIVGLIALGAPKRPGMHIQYGRYFSYLLTVVVGTGLAGVFVFRTSSFLMMLTLLAGYVGYAGYRTIQLRERRTSAIDAVLAIVVLLAGMLYAGWSRESGQNWAPSVVYPTLSALALVTTYDFMKHVWLYERLKTWWIYEHIYKMVSAFSALLSAFAGTVLPEFKPYSQIGPSVLCLWLIAYFIWRQARILSRTRHESIPV